MKLIFFCLILFLNQIVAKFLVENIADLNNFKVRDITKVCKSRKNILIFFNNVDSDNDKRDEYLTLLAEAALLVEGYATLAAVDCLSKEGKKLCKTLKGLPDHDQPFRMRHYKGCDFNREYERVFNPKTIERFLYDPDGETPWADESNNQGVIHFESSNAFLKHIKSSKLPTLVMFYAPKCVHCKNLKPQFSAAATELKGKIIFAAIDMLLPPTKPLNEHFKINGFPTLYYIENGKIQPYTGQHSKESILQWFGKSEKTVEKLDISKIWLSKDSKVIHLTNKNADDKLKKHVLIMYHTPECFSCQAIKKFYMEAAKILASQKNVMLSAVDCKTEIELCKKHEIDSFPTISYYKNGKKSKNFNDAATTDNFVKFIHNEIEHDKMEEESSTPSPPLQYASQVLVATSKNFEQIVFKEKQIVMFCLPSNKVCQNIIHIFNDVAKLVMEGSMVAVDCSQDKQFCLKKNITAFPSYQIFKNGKFSRSFEADTIEDFVNALSGKPPIPKLEFGEEVKVGTHWNIDDLIASNDRTLVLFYAPWCGHCKAVKPEFSKAAKQMKKANFIALDCTRYQMACRNFDVTSYPSLKIFVAGKFYANYAGERSAKGFVNAFHQNRSIETPNDEFGFSPKVIVVKEDSFKRVIGTGKSFVLFYAPWCGYCKKVKPEYSKAAENDKSGKYIAVDCTVNQNLCKIYGIRSYPSFKFFADGEMIKTYKGERTSADFNEALKTFKGERNTKKEHTEL